MFFRNTYYSCGRSLHPGVQMDIDEFNAGATLASHPGGWGGGGEWGSRKIFICFMPLKLGYAPA